MTNICITLVNISIILFFTIIPAFAQISDEEAIEEKTKSFYIAYNMGDVTKIGGIYTINAIAMPPNQLKIEGQNDIVDLWKNYINLEIRQLEFTPEEVVVSNMVAYQIGKYSMIAPDPLSGSVEVGGQYVMIWNKDNSGEWFIYRHIWNIAPQ
jgi:ketosteroid isomerase-like protein